MTTAKLDSEFYCTHILRRNRRSLTLHPVLCTLHSFCRLFLLGLDSLLNLRLGNRSVDVKDLNVLKHRQLRSNFIGILRHVLCRVILLSLGLVKALIDVLRYSRSNYSVISPCHTQKHKTPRIILGVL